MSAQVISDDYPEHLNPFDDNYNPVPSTPMAPPRANSSRQKYNTWTSNRQHQVVTQKKPSFLEKPWAALNISPKGKLVRRLSILKTTVERFAKEKTRKLDRSRSPSCRAGSLPPSSNSSLHEGFNYRIISPKVKEKIRQQVFTRSLSTEEQKQTETNKDSSPSPQLNGLQFSPKLDSETQIETGVCPPTSPESERDISFLGARPKTLRKKRPPPPPPPLVVTAKQTNLKVENGQEKADDCISASSSITQDLEKDASTDDDTSLEDQQNIKPGDQTS